MGPKWEGKQHFRPGLCWTWPCTFALAPLQCVLQPTVASGRSAPFVLLKAGAVTQGGEEALHSSHRLCASGVQHTGLTWGSGSKATSRQGSIQVGEGAASPHQYRGRGTPGRRCCCVGPLRAWWGLWEGFTELKGPTALGCANSWFCTELCYVTFFCLLPSLSTSSHVRGWLFKEPHGHGTASSLLSPRQVDRKCLSCGQTRGTVGLVLL